jgi:hypothetical protein
MKDLPVILMALVATLPALMRAVISTFLKNDISPNHSTETASSTAGFVRRLLFALAGEYDAPRRRRLK